MTHQKFMFSSKQRWSLSYTISPSVCSAIIHQFIFFQFMKTLGRWTNPFPNLMYNWKWGAVFLLYRYPQTLQVILLEPFPLGFSERGRKKPQQNFLGQQFMTPVILIFLLLLWLIWVQGLCGYWGTSWAKLACASTDRFFVLNLDPGYQFWVNRESSTQVQVTYPLQNFAFQSSLLEGAYRACVLLYTY